MPDTRFANRASTPSDFQTILQLVREANPTWTKRQLRLLATVLATVLTKPASSSTPALLAWSIADLAGNRRTLPLTPDTILQIAKRLDALALEFLAAHKLIRTTEGTPQ